MLSHWPEYVCEALLLGGFLFSACIFGVLLFLPESPASELLPDATVRRAVMGAAMGLTAVALIHSPPGLRSGAHMNPAVTLAFLRFGRIRPPDALGYMVAQFVGAMAGVGAARIVLGDRLAHRAVDFAVTQPGASGGLGSAIAWVVEFAMASTMMTVVLSMASRPAIAARTGLAAGALVAIFIVVAAPVSGMSINPARSLGSALHAGTWSDLWIYFTAPPLAMLMAAERHWRRAGRDGPERGHRLEGARALLRCAKLVHTTRYRCIHCGAAAAKE